VVSGGVSGAIYSRPYLESSVYIALIKGEFINGIDRGDIAQRILDDASNGRWPILTATFTLAEVLKDKGRPILTPDEERRIDAFFRHDYIKLVTLDRRVAEHARSLARQHGLSPADAIHLASAIRSQADELLKWDKGFPRTMIEGVTIKDPYWFGQLPMRHGN
jgi:predicted nucleic acid-binding protein